MIVVGKFPTSTSELTQPCDVGPCFITGKRKFWTFEHIKSQTISELELHWKNIISNKFYQHKTKYPQAKIKSTQMILGLIHVFWKLEPHPKSGLLLKKWYPSLWSWKLRHKEIILDCTSSPWKIKWFTQDSEEKREISDAKLRKMHFPIEDTPKDKDNRPLYELRTVILNHEHIQLEEHERAEKNHTELTKEKGRWRRN